MKFYKNYITAVIVLLIIISCGSSDDGLALEYSVSIEITSFKTSKNQVEISWDLERFNNAIVTDLVILRYSNDVDADNTNRQQIIANLPSNETTFIDEDVPYLEDLHYIVKARFYIEKGKDFEYFDIQSEEVLFERFITKISRIPNHIIQDPKDANCYHFMVRSSEINLYRYNMKTNSFDANKNFNNGYNYYDKIITDGDAIYVGSKAGVIDKLKSTDYSNITSYSLPITDELESFSIRQSEIHFCDSELWKYLNIDSNISGTVNSTSYTNFVYSLDLPANQMLIIRKYYPYFSGALYNISTFNELERLYITDFKIDFGSPLDKGILHFKADRTQFISTIFGRVISTTDLSLEAELKDVTGENYLYFNYDNNGKLYGAVQGKKLIHVFDDTSFELINSIETKLYPLYPLLSENGELQSLGRYSRVGYWDYFDGFQLYSSHPNCAIETF